MIEILLAANALLCLLWCVLLLLCKAPRVAALVAAFHFVLFVVKPLASEYLDFVPSLIDFRAYPDAYSTYLGCGALFLATSAALYYGFLPAQKRFGQMPTTIAEPTKFAAALSTFIALIGLSVVANIVRFGDPLYFVRLGSSFDAMLSNVDRWYLNVIVECPLIAIGMVAGRIRTDRGVAHRLLCVVVMLAVFVFLSRPSTRTGAMAMMIAVLVESFGGRRISVLKTASIVIILMIAYVSLSFLRLGEGVSLSASALLGIVGIFMVGFAPADLAVKLLSTRPPDDDLWFRYLLGALDPLIVVPSGLLPFDKPRADLEAWITDTYFGPLVDLSLFTEGSTLTFTAPASAYLNLSWIGVVVMGGVYAALLLGATYAAHSARSSQRILGIYWLITLCAGYRYSVEGAVVGAYSLGVLLTIYIVLEWWVARTFALFRARQGESV